MRPFLRALAIGAVLVTVLTAPTLTRMTSVGRLDTNDGRFSIWNVAWIDHAALTNPRALLDANIFWPHQGTLAYSELNLVAGALGLPFYVVTRDPLAALNGAVAVALMLAFVTMWALVRRLSGSDGAGLVAATAFTFCPFVSARTPHIQLLMVFVFPLVMLAFHRLVERPGVGRGVALGAALAVAGLACGYYGIFAGLALGLAAVSLARHASRYWIGLAASLLTAVALVYPIYRSFVAARAAVSASVTLPSSPQEWSANWSAYLASAAVGHEWWLEALQRWQKWNEVLFPGIGVMLLAALGLFVVRRGPMARVVWTYLAIAAAAMWASFGPTAGLYAVLDAVVPGMQLLRAPARLGIVVTFALAVIAGFGVARLERRWRWAPAVLVVVLALELSVKTAEWGWPSWPLRQVEPLSPAHAQLATLPRGPLVEYPFPYEKTDFHNHARAMFWSTYHWQPLVNGYSDVIPPDMIEIALPINGFPDATSFAIMKARSVRYVLWNMTAYRGQSELVLRERLATYGAYLRPIIQSQDEWLFEIVRWP